MASTQQKTSRGRLRWLTFAEIIGVAALVVAVVAYFDSHQAAEKQLQAQAAQQASRQTFLMKGDVDKKGGVVRLVAVHDEQVIQTQTLWFPKDVRADKVELSGEPRLEADWIADGVRKAAGAAKRGRVPVTVQTTYIQDGDTRTDQSVYELAYSLHPRLLLGDEVKLEGVSLARRNVAGDPQAAAEKLWTK